MSRSENTPITMKHWMNVFHNANRAVFLQLLHDMMQENIKNGRRQCITKSYEEWHLHLPFLSIRTIKRIVYFFREIGIIITTSGHCPDRTLIYSINYKRLENVCTQVLSGELDFGTRRGKKK